MLCSQRSPVTLAHIRRSSTSRAALWASCPERLNSRNLRMNNYAAYAEDTWRWRRVVVLLGLRWDSYGVVYERDSLVLTVVGEQQYVATLRSNATLDFGGSAVSRTANS